MTGLKSFFRLWVLLAALTVFTQTVSLAHAASNGDAPHEHNGIACDLGGLVTPDVVIEPPVNVPILLDFKPVKAAISTRQVIAWTWPPGRAPPPRSPPAITQ